MKLRAALAQINPTVGDLEGNFEKIVRYLEEAKRKGADLVVFPELSVTGYPPEDLLFKKSFLKESFLTVKKLLPHTRGLVCLVGCVEPADGKIYNACALLADGRLRGTYRKNHLPNYGVFDEKRYFEPGREGLVFTQNGLSIGITICEDLWVEKGPFLAEARKGGARVIVNLSASPYEVGKVEERRKLLSRRAKETKAHFVYVNLIGGQDELVFDGGSMVLDDKGKLLALARQFEEELLLCDLPSPAISVRRALGREEEMYRALVLGTKDYVTKNRFEKVVLGLSGGIDSALVACIAADALGRDRVVGVSMPSRFSSAETRSDAKALEERLGLRYLELPIESVFKSFLELLKGLFQGTKEGLAEENLQARIRGMILMALSNKFGWLVLTTGNKSEMSTGYCTLYGDMAGGFAVIKDVPKGWVYELARVRNQKEKVIPETVLTREPTAELRAHQKDSDTLPPYEVLDPILSAYIEENLTLAGMKRKGLDEKVAQEVIQRVDGNEYKRRQGPPGIKITSRAFGKDWRFPITNRYRKA